MSQRASGILLHLTSLSNPYPIGDLGPAATAFVDFMVESGQRWWQMLPIGPAGGDNSPYRSPSAFGGNPLLISPDRLLEQGLLSSQDVELPISRDEGNVDYPAATRTKLQWLRKAFEHFEKNRHSGQQQLGCACHPSTERPSRSWSYRSQQSPAATLCGLDPVLPEQVLR